MADDSTQTDDGQIDDNQTTDDKTDVTEQSDSDFMADTVDQIKDTQKAILDEDNSDNDDDDNKDSSDGVKADLAGTGIPDAFSTVAEASGMSPEDIIAIADKSTDEELIELIPHLQAALENKDDDTTDDKTGKQDGKTDKNGDNKNTDTELEAKIADKIAKQLEEKFSTSLEEIEKFKANQEEQSIKQTVDQASKLFDEASKEFSVFGKTDELPKFPSGRLAGQLIPTSPAMKARMEVLQYADSFMGSGLDIDSAMNNALATYRGIHLTKEVERNMVKNLKNHETKLSGARVGKETKKKHTNTRDEIIDDIEQMQRQAGIN